MAMSPCSEIGIVAVGEPPAGVTGPETEVVDAAGAYLIPGFIEPHLHAGEPSLSPGDLAFAPLQRGTTTLATDLVEFYAVGGLPAVLWALSELQTQGLRTLFLLPLHLLGTERLGTHRHVPTVADFLEMGSWPQTAGVNEPPPHAILEPDSGISEVLDAVLKAPEGLRGPCFRLAGPRFRPTSRLSRNLGSRVHQRGGCAREASTWLLDHDAP